MNLSVGTRLVLLTGAILLSAGCGAKQATLSGNVTFDGTPVEQGVVRLFPEGDTPGKGGAAEIINGEFSIPPKHHLFEGDYKVVVFGFHNTGKFTIEPEIIGIEEGGTGEREKVEIVDQYIPTQFNRSSKLIVHLRPGDNAKEFDLDP